MARVLHFARSIPPLPPDPPLGRVGTSLAFCKERAKCGSPSRAYPYHSTFRKSYYPHFRPPSPAPVCVLSSTHNASRYHLVVEPSWPSLEGCVVCATVVCRPIHMSLRLPQIRLPPVVVYVAPHTTRCGIHLVVCRGTKIAKEKV